MTYNFSPLKQKTLVVSEWLKKEYAVIRTGRASPAILDSLSVELYGARMAIRQLGSVSIEDARTLRITPYDQAHAKEIEKVIGASNLGVSALIDDRGLRVVFPELTAERRQSYLKVVKEKLEEARKKVRAVRDEVWKDIQEKERAGAIREDEKFRLKDEMQKIIDGVSASLDEQFSRKEKEIQS